MEKSVFQFWRFQTKNEQQNVFLCGKNRNVCSRQNFSDEKLMELRRNTIESLGNRSWNNFSKNVPERSCWEIGNGTTFVPNLKISDEEWTTKCFSSWGKLQGIMFETNPFGSKACGIVRRNTKMSTTFVTTSETKWMIYSKTQLELNAHKTCPTRKKQQWENYVSKKCHFSHSWYR